MALSKLNASTFILLTLPSNGGDSSHSYSAFQFISLDGAGGLVYFLISDNDPKCLYQLYNYNLNPASSEAQQCRTHVSKNSVITCKDKRVVTF